MEVHDIGRMRYSFVFFHKMNVQKVVDGGPRSIEQPTQILHQLANGEDQSMVKLQYVECGCSL